LAKICPLEAEMFVADMQTEICRD